MKQGLIKLSGTNLEFKTNLKKVLEVRIIPKSGAYCLEIVYEQPSSSSQEGERYAFIDLGLTNHYYVAEVSENLGREINVGISFFNNQDAGNLLNVSALGILQTSEKQEASLKLLRYLLSKPTQEKFVAETYEYSLLAMLYLKCFYYHH